MSGRIVVLISGSGSNMEALADACERGQVPGSVVAVVADRDCIGLRAAEKRGIPAEAVTFGDFPDRETWGARVLDVVRGHRPDLVVSAGFMRILPAAFVDAFPERLINLHPALLPAFRGAHAVRDALAAGVRVTGTTIHFVVPEVDAGPIILQEAVRVEPRDTEDSLHERIKAMEHRLLPEACRLVLDGRLRIEDNRVSILEGG